MTKVSDGIKLGLGFLIVAVLALGAVALAITVYSNQQANREVLCTYKAGPYADSPIKRSVRMTPSECLERNQASYIEIP